MTKPTKSEQVKIFKRAKHSASETLLVRHETVGSPDQNYGTDVMCWLESSSKVKNELTSLN